MSKNFSTTKTIFDFRIVRTLLKDKWKVNAMKLKFLIKKKSLLIFSKLIFNFKNKYKICKLKRFLHPKFSFNFKNSKLHIFRNYAHTLSFYNILTLKWYNYSLMKFKKAAAALFLLGSVKKYILEKHINLIQHAQIYKKSSLLLLKKNNIITLWRKRRSFKIYPSSVWLAYVHATQLRQPRFRIQYLFRRVFFYQKPLTKFLTTLYRLRAINLIYWYELQLWSILYKSSFFFKKSDIFFFIRQNLILINFNPINDFYHTVAIWDLLSFKLNFYILLFFLKKFRNLNFYKFKLYKFFFKTKKRRSRFFPKTPSFRYSNWILNQSFHFFRTPVYFELDWLSMSIIILNIFFLKQIVFSLFFIHFFPVASLRNFNWKYLT